MGDARHIGLGHRFGEAADRVVAAVDLHQRGAVLAQRRFVVFLMGAVGGAHLDQAGAGARHHIRDAEGAANLDQLAARDHHLLVARQRGQHQQHGGRIVVDDGGRFGAGQAADQVFDQVIAVAAAAVGQVVLQIAGGRQRLHHGVDGLLGQQRPAQVGVQHRAGQVVDRFQTRRKQLLELLFGGVQQGIGTVCAAARLCQPAAAGLAQRCADGLRALGLAVAVQQRSGARVLQQLVNRGQVGRCVHGQTSSNRGRNKKTMGCGSSAIVQYGMVPKRSGCRHALNADRARCHRHRPPAARPRPRTAAGCRWRARTRSARSSAGPASGWPGHRPAARPAGLFPG